MAWPKMSKGHCIIQHMLTLKGKRQENTLKQDLIQDNMTAEIWAYELVKAQIVRERNYSCSRLPC